MTEPIRKFKDFPVIVSVWENEFKKDGKSFTIRSVDVQTTYKDKDNSGKDVYKYTKSLKKDHILKAIVQLGKAYNFLHELEETEFKKKS